MTVQKKLADTLRDSMNKIRNQQTENASQEWITVKAYAELYERATIMSTTIARFTTETKVLLLDIEEEYMYVKSQFGNGYVKLYYLKSEKSNLKTITSSSLSPKTKSTSNSSSSNSQSSYNRKTYNTSRTYYKGPRGGCYYFNSNGNKTYVSRSQCSCG